MSLITRTLLSSFLAHGIKGFKERRVLELGFIVYSRTRRRGTNQGMLLTIQTPVARSSCASPVSSKCESQAFRMGRGDATAAELDVRIKVWASGFAVQGSGFLSLPKLLRTRRCHYYPSYDGNLSISQFNTITLQSPQHSCSISIPRPYSGAAVRTRLEPLHSIKPP